MRQLERAELWGDLDRRTRRRARILSALLMLGWAVVIVTSYVWELDTMFEGASVGQTPVRQRRL